MNRKLNSHILFATLAMFVASVPTTFRQGSASSWAESAALTSPVETPTNTARYKIDPSQSRFIVRAFAGGLLSAFAHDHTISIREFDGETDFTYGTVEPAALKLTIKAGSLAVTDKVSEKDRQKIETTMRDEVLEVSKYPEITFQSSSVTASKTGEGQYQAKIAGEITIRGVSKPLTIPAQLDFGGNKLRAQGAFALKQSSFGIKPVSVGGGTIKVKDELKFTFDIVAHP